MTLEAEGRDMGLMKDLLITVYGGGDEAVAAVERMGKDWREQLEQAASEIERLRLTDAEREAIECGIQAIGLAPYDERTLAYAATLRGLLERTRNGAVDGRETVQ
jgi:hypothetical protein